MTLNIYVFKVLTTGVDGGHKYIETEILYQGRNRRLTAFFKDKHEEQKIKFTTTLVLSGQLKDDGEQYGLLLLDTIII